MFFLKSAEKKDNSNQKDSANQNQNDESDQNNKPQKVIESHKKQEFKKLEQHYGN